MTEDDVRRVVREELATMLHTFSEHCDFQSADANANYGDFLLKQARLFRDAAHYYGAQMDFAPPRAAEPDDPAVDPDHQLPIPRNHP